MTTAELLLPVRLTATGGHWGDTVEAGVTDLVLEDEPVDVLELDGELVDVLEVEGEAVGEAITPVDCEAEGVTEEEGVVLGGPAAA